MTPSPDDVNDPFPPVPVPPDPGPAADCWRCGLGFAAAPRCLHCAAPARGWVDPAPDAGRPPADEWVQLRAVLAAFLAMMTASVVWAWVVWFGPPLDDDDLRAGTAVLGAVDAVITLALLAAVGRPPAQAGPVPGRARAFAWLSAGPALALLFGLNYLYYELFRWLLPPAAVPAPEPVTLAAVLLTCVQPAVVEELFFRYLALGVLRRATGRHAAVGASAALFAVAHLYNPFGMPYLFVAGLVFGHYWAAGGLALPVLLHFGHNLAVLAAEAP